METVNLFALQLTELVQLHIKSPHTGNAEDLLHLCKLVTSAHVNSISSSEVLKLLDIAGNKAYESDCPDSQKWLKQVNILREDYYLRNSPLHQNSEVA